ncbi:FCD domain-containing protein [Actinomycetaceae bacterium L2_0104]
MNENGGSHLRRNDPRGLSHALAVRLKSEIAAGHLAAGDRVPSEAELGRAYEVSRTVVREAVSQLRAEGLVETFQGRGSFIAAAGPLTGRGDDVESFTLDLSASRSARDVMELRLGLETQAAALAARRHRAIDLAGIDRALADFEHAVATQSSTIAADFAIHRAIAVASGNSLIVEIISALGSQSVLLQRASLHEEADVISPGHGELLRHEHRQIGDAISRGDSEGARAAMFTHLARSMAAL